MFMCGGPNAGVLCIYVTEYYSFRKGKRSLTRALSFISCIVLVLVQGGDALMLVLMLQEMFAKKMFAKLVN